MAITKLFFLLSFALQALSFSLEDLPIEARVLESQMGLRLSPQPEGTFISHTKAGKYFNIPLKSNFFDFTLPIKNVALLEESKIYNCPNLDSLESIYTSETCRDFFLNYLRSLKIVFIVINDKEQTSLNNKNNCLNITSSVKFHLIKQLELKKNTRTTENPYRCQFRSADELFLVDYFYKSITSIKKRSDLIQKKYTEKGLDPDYIQDFKARRFIDRKDWAFALRVRTQLEQVYKPAPSTWKNWQDVAFKDVLSYSTLNKELSLAEVIKWNLDSLEREQLLNPDGTLVYPEEVNSYLRQFVKKDWVQAEFKTQYSALSKEQIQRLENFVVEGHRSAKLIKWEKRPCNDFEMPGKECGNLVYVAPYLVKQYLEEMIKKINLKLSQEVTDTEIFKFAIHMQKQIVALHPFIDGNGRISRWIMDYITLKSDLPYILHFNMNDDLTTHELEFEAEAKRGMFHGVLIQERCLDKDSRYCRY